MLHVKLENIFLPSVVELILFLGNLAINLLLNLSKLQLGTEHLVLLGLQSGFGLLKSGLKLLLLSLRLS